MSQMANAPLQVHTMEHVASVSVQVEEANVQQKNGRQSKAVGSARKALVFLCCAAVTVALALGVGLGVGLRRSPGAAPSQPVASPALTGALCITSGFPNLTSVQLQQLSVGLAGYLGVLSRCGN